jgi:hypothetical protein
MLWVTYGTAPHQCILYPCAPSGMPRNGMETYDVVYQAAMRQPHHSMSARLSTPKAEIPDPEDQGMKSTLKPQFTVIVDFTSQSSRRRAVSHRVQRIFLHTVHHILINKAREIACLKP